ncbi:hypothetical protein [Desulfofustis glycolicus]|uniref:hypothetical protein n=1 Tax=Desulfofustis glycolicus TaxID=51195 RepID=UPI00116142A5|nr:hypothetical protein [Desulfofustis glycolicus]MCB2217903.1 hypothetical protein [Desulfobulbaceae bacterium]
MSGFFVLGIAPMMPGNDFVRIVYRVLCACNKTIKILSKINPEEKAERLLCGTTNLWRSAGNVSRRCHTIVGYCSG